VPFSVVESGEEFFDHHGFSLFNIGDWAFKDGRTSGIALVNFVSVFLGLIL